MIICRGMNSLLLKKKYSSKHIAVTYASLMKKKE